MSCEHLVCANCAHPVAEGRCPTCRAARNHVHETPAASYAWVFGIALLILAVLALLGNQLAG